MSNPEETYPAGIYPTTLDQGSKGISVDTILLNHISTASSGTIATMKMLTLILDKTEKIEKRLKRLEKNLTDELLNY